MIEETREHRMERTFALVPPGKDRLRLRGSSTHGMPLPMVFMESASQKQAKRNERGCLRRYVRPLVYLVVIAFCVDLAHDYCFGDMGTPSPPIIQRDYAHVNGIRDVTSDHVQSKCFHKKPSCKCPSQTEPVGRPELPQWSHVHHLNKEASQEHEYDDVDVVFLGDSITEGWMGTSYGRKNAVVHDVPDVFKEYFSLEGKGRYEGLALGIAGDTSPNLLWRIQNGELPDNLNPHVIWVLIGTNDFGNTWCSAEMVLIGIIRVIEELLVRKPAATIVVNGLLPRTYNRQGYVSKGRSRKWWRTKSPPAMPSLWDDIEAVNDELKTYAAGRPNVEYFETKAFFVDGDLPDESLQIDSKLMPDFLHPSSQGYRLWGEEIVEKLNSLIPKR